MVETVLGERSTEEDLRKLQRCIEALQCARCGRQGAMPG